MDVELLMKVKKGLGITGDYQDDILTMYIDEAKQYMLSAGVPQSVIDSPMSVGTIIRGVSDLWDYGSGTTNLSPYFKERCIQLRTLGENNEL